MKLGLISLGCPKNTVDTEVMLSVLGNAVLTTNPYEADVILINTCAFLKSARDESISAISDMFRVKKKRPGLKIIVAGCFVSKDHAALLTKFPQVHAWLGINDIINIRKAIEKGGVYTGAKPFVYNGRQHSSILNGVSAYVKISEGCNHACSFCAIPGIKGRYRSREQGDIAREIKALLDSGVREINLISQDLTYYGMDNNRKKKIASLLEKILKAAGNRKFWLRLLYLYPDIKVIQGIADVMNKDRRVCRYIDIPFQHVSDTVLKSMRRGYEKKDVLNITGMLKSRVKGITIRTSFITGYPGETKADFQEMREFIKGNHVDRCGIFPYSDEPGTKAHTLTKKVSRLEIKRRRRILLVDSAGVYNYNNNRKKGETLSCLVLKEKGRGLYVGRTEGDAPDIDGYIEIRSRKKLVPGYFCMVKITGTVDMDLKGDAVWTGKK